MCNKNKRLLLFGSTGSIGRAIAQKFSDHDWEVIGVSRSLDDQAKTVSWNPIQSTEIPISKYLEIGFDSVCWAQGINLNDSIINCDLDRHKEVYEVNVIYIIQSLQALLKNNLLNASAKLCVISSIWQDIARQNKLSYCVSKSALHGLVLSLANDLASHGYLVNAVLPGALDTSMTRANLSEAQLKKIEESTFFSKLPNTNDVANTVYFLSSNLNTALTGQFIKVDYGFSDVRII